MPFSICIFYSASTDKYYVGFTGDDLSKWLRKHNGSYKGFTSEANNWAICITESFEGKPPAQLRESETASWKSWKQIECMPVIIRYQLITISNSK